MSNRELREILFRGKRVDNGEWVEGYYYLHQDGISYIIIHSTGYPSNRYVEVLSETVGQYTGLKDKNGTKIFEGDILRNNLNNCLAIVNWKEVHTGFTLNMQGTVYNFPKIGCELYTIISNIHDNFKLLEKGV